MKVLTKKKTESQIQGAIRTETSGVNDDETSRGELNALLREGLYSNKEGAAVRETIANATDEHIRHGIEVPVEVTLPTLENDCLFKVRDFAKGLSENEVFDVFFKYFNSTKRKCSLTTGCKGLGSKAFSAIADNYIVISRHEGIKMTFFACVQNQSLTASLAESVESDEPSGIEIYANLKYMHALRVVSYFKEFIEGFSPHFRNIIVTNQEDVPDIKYGLEIPEIEKSSKGFSQVWQRGIFYKIEHSYKGKFFTVRAEDNVIFDIHPSREYLSLTERNISLFESIAKRAGEKMVEDFKTGYPKDASMFEKWIWLKARKEEASMAKTFGFNPVSLSFDSSNEVSIKDLCVRVYELCYYDYDNHDSEIYKDNSYNFERYGCVKFDPKIKYFFIRQTVLSKGKYEALKKRIKKEDIKNSFVIAGGNYQDIVNKFNNYIDGAGSLIEDISDLKPEKIKSESPGKIKVFWTKYGRERTAHLNCAEKNVYYFPCLRGEAKSWEDCRIAHFISESSNDIRVVGINSSNLKDVPKHWRHVGELAKPLKRRARKLNYENLNIPTIPAGFSDDLKNFIRGKLKGERNPFPFSPEKPKKTPNLDRANKILDFLNDKSKMPVEGRVAMRVVKDHNSDEEMKAWAKNKIEEIVYEIA